MKGRSKDGTEKKGRFGPFKPMRGARGAAEAKQREDSSPKKSGSNKNARPY